MPRVSKRITANFARPLLIFGLLTAALAFSVAMSGSSRSLSPKDRVHVFEKVWKDVDVHYYDPEFGGVDWKAIHQRYLPQVKSAKDDHAFYSTLDRMTSELHDAHTRFSSPEQWKNHEKHLGLSIGFRAGYVEGKVVVLEVLPGSNAANAGVTPGMILNSVDGQPITDRLAAATKRELPTSTERATKLRILGDALAGPPDSLFTASLTRADGTTLDVKYARQFLSYAPKVTVEKLPSGFGYIRFDEFDPALVKDFRADLKSLQGTPGLILDLRWNRGGVGATLESMAGYFFNRRKLFERRMSRNQVAASEREGHPAVEMEYFVGKKGGRIYSGPLVILMSEYSASATEVFAAGMQDTGRATIVGGPSCGCVLGITHQRVMKGGGVLEISEILWFSPQGRRLEGEGVVPNRLAFPTIASLEEKKDVVLDAGEKELQELVSKEANPRQSAQ